jgi:predicted transposase YdaD
VLVICGPEVFEQPQLTWLLPLLPLTKDGQNLETVERMIRKMEQAGKKDMLWVAKAIAGLVLKSVEDKQQLKETFEPMLDEILKESWVYQETIEEGKKKGIEEGKEQEKKQGLLLLVELRFPSLLVLAKQVIEGGMPLQQLEALQKQLYQANTTEEAQAALLSNE